MFQVFIKGKAKPFTAYVLCGIILFWAGPVFAQIYDDALDKAGWRDPKRSIAITAKSYLEAKDMEAFLGGDYDLSRYASEYKKYLKSTLLPNQNTKLNDDEFQNRLKNNMAACYLWMDDSRKALPILEELAKKTPNELGPIMYRDVQYNLATALEKEGLLAEALKVAQRMQAIPARMRQQHEDMRIVRLEYKIKSRNPAWAQKNLSVAPYTAAWEDKGLPPLAFQKFRPPGGIDSESYKYMRAIQADPDFPDFWLLLGILNERRGKSWYKFAHDSYQMARDNGHVLSNEIGNHASTLRSHMPGGYTLVAQATRSFFIILAVIALVVGYLVISKWFERRVALAARGAKAKWKDRQDKKWRPDRWEDHHIQSLEEELEERLRDEDDSDNDGK